MISYYANLPSASPAGILLAKLIKMKIRRPAGRTTCMMLCDGCQDELVLALLFQMRW
jgi:hypothetical protein